jgi:hypothetical protein
VSLRVDDDDPRWADEHVVDVRGRPGDSSVVQDPPTLLPERIQLLTDSTFGKQPRLLAGDALTK